MGRYWDKHPNKDLEKLLEEFDAAGWIINNPRKKYYSVYCRCPGKHKRMIKLTPSNGNYILDTRKWLHRQPCYRKSNGGGAQ